MRTILLAFSLATVFVCCSNDPVSPTRENLGLPEEVTFTHLPTDLSRMSEFAAIGQIFTIPKAHGGFGVKDFYAVTQDIPVYAMSDGIIYNITYGSQPFEEPWAPAGLEGQEYEDNALFIYLTKTAGMHYGHVGKLAPEILQEAGHLIRGNNVNPVQIHIKAGQVLAYIGTHPGFDVGLYDVKDLPYFANPERYTAEYRSSIPFTDYLTHALREEVFKINPRTVEPLGGKIHYDVEGTIAGNWVLEGTTSLADWSRILIIARHERYADRIMISDGTPFIEGDGGQEPAMEPHLWWIYGNAPLPETVTPASGKVKYKVATWWRLAVNEDTPPEGTVLIEMTANDRMMYEYLPGKVPEEVGDFTTAVKRYER